MPHPTSAAALAGFLVCALGAHAAAAAAQAPHLAYVDPGAGSFVLQALVATIAGAVVAVNAYWRKIRAFLGRPVADPDEEKKTGLAPEDD